MDKQEIRAAMKQKKRALTERQIALASEQLAELLLAHPLYLRAHSVYGYLPFNQEVRMAPILRAAQKSGRRVAVPKITDGRMRFFWLDDLDSAVPGAFGIPEPPDGCPEADDETALIVVPGLAFDRRGNRVGYGGGYYDRYLSAHPAHPTLALCYGFQLVPALPAEPCDRPVDEVLSVFTEGLL